MTISALYWDPCTWINVLYIDMGPRIHCIIAHFGRTLPNWHQAIIWTSDGLVY